MSNIKAFIFDSDGVITESSEFHYRAWKALANSIGIDFDRNFNENLKGVSRLESLERILILGGKDRSYTLEEKMELADWKNAIYKQMIRDITPADLFEGIQELFQKLRSRMIKIAIASVSRNAQAIIGRLGIEKYIDYIVNVDEIKSSKPAPDIFLKAAEVLGVKPEECVGIEDAEVGIEAIKAAGMLAVGVGTPQKMHAADIVFASPEELMFDEILRVFEKG